ncbi:MAG: hypothetical protein SNJ70_06205 [Armatimonadota bacterium]
MFEGIINFYSQIMIWVSANSKSITIWCGALCTLAIYSILYAENKFYRFFEHIFIGLATGYGLYFVWAQLLYPRWWIPMVSEGKWYWIFVALPGSMFYFIYSKKHMWISRIIFGLLMGLAAGQMFREFALIVFPQIGASMKPLFGDGVSIVNSFNAVVFYIVLFVCIMYFFFSYEHKSNASKKINRLGRWFLMIGFGTIFGATVMGRMTLFIGRVDFFVVDVKPQISNAWEYLAFRVLVFGILAAIAAFAIKYFIDKSKNNNQLPE